MRLTRSRWQYVNATMATMPVDSFTAADGQNVMPDKPIIPNDEVSIRLDNQLLQNASVGVGLGAAIVAAPVLVLAAIEFVQPGIWPPPDWMWKPLLISAGAIAVIVWGLLTAVRGCIDEVFDTERIAKIIVRDWRNRKQLESVSRRLNALLKEADDKDSIIASLNARLNGMQPVVVVDEYSKLADDARALINRAYSSMPYKRDEMHLYEAWTADRWTKAMGVIKEAGFARKEGRANVIDVDNREVAILRVTGVVEKRRTNAKTAHYVAPAPALVED